MYSEKSFKDLIVWQKSIKLVEEIYVLIKLLPDSEKFGIASQMSRAAVSIPSNIAEGQKRGSQQEFKRFVGMARGSAAELETQIIIVGKLYDASTSEVMENLEEVQKMLTKLYQSLR